jgi:2'-5' RNA ligase
MRVFVGIPLIDELGEGIIRFSRLPLFSRCLRLSTVEPHLTLKAPQEIPDDELDRWIDTATAAIRKHMPQTVQFTEPFFITPMTMAIGIETNPLCQLHLALVEALGSYDTPGIVAHEGADFIGHATIGRAIKHLLIPERTELVNTSRSFFNKQPVKKDLIRLYGRDNFYEGYRSITDVKLSGSS